MNKLTEKRKIYNKQVVERLMEMYGVSRRFVTMSLRGDRVSETSESIKKEYTKLAAEVNEATKKVLQKK